MKKNIFIPLLILLISSCASSVKSPSESIANSNEMLAQKYSPYRWKNSKLENGSSMLTKFWAGTIKNSIADKTLKNDILKQFKVHCGFNLVDLKEIRVVSHKSPIFYEVWVFNDHESTKQDNTSAMSVIMKASPKGGVDLNFIGECHS